ncbi:uncharacterized protein LOC128547872 [Mercenaria mercenaria]|uniref:uncharacterized protein LOC128547872 n=1 Tax=Mercenaria mercenaria TaxID=6596 RepID=UPI00234FAB21|nr:uncharacterized protein LOC128547872 [Mercenaria mercenaria]
MKTEFTTFVFISMCTVTVPGERKDRSIPVEHSCNRLPYILKGTELQFSYSAGHLTDRSCAVTVTANAQDKVCVTFVQFYLDCYTDIILVDEAVPLQKNIYKCDSRHTSDFCSRTSLEIIFQRKKNLQADSFGHVKLRVYGIAESDSIPASTVTVLIVVGGLLGIVLLLVASSFILSRILYHFHHKHRRQNEQHFSHEEAPLEPPPPYPGPDSEQQEMSTNSSQH